MFHFFRRIRQAFLTDNKYQKYLIYAIGEVLLVVIGILIALQINNWNENRKTRASELEALKNLHQEFVVNQEKFENHIEPKRELTERWKSLLLKISDENLPKSEKPQLRNLPPGSRTLNISFGILNSLISSGKIEIIRNDSLKSSLSNWDSILEEFEEEEQVHWEINRHYFQHYPLPNPFFVGAYRSQPSWLFHTDAERIELFKEAFKDINYQNLMINNYMALRSTLEDAEPLAKGFQVIIGLLEEEIEKF